ncbi:hypothetical protein EPN44_15130 [bacterium]|nr:MAG: hypothetical protein EPN44_15130 [bacterium]
MSWQRGLVRLVFAVVFGAGALFVLAPDGDFPWQNWLGQTILATHRIPRTLGTETFTAVGAPWVPQEWLYGLAAHVVWSGAGYPLFALLIAACAFAALILVERRCASRGVRGTALALCVGLAGISMLESFGARAQVAAWPLLAALLVLLDDEGWRLWLVLPLTALWSNVHASVVIAPCVVLLDAAGRWLETRSLTPAIGRRFVLAGGVGMATWVNPFGWGLDAYAIELFRSPIARTIQEWRPANLQDLSLVAGALPLALLAFLGLRSRLLTLREIPLAAVFLVLAFAHVRNVPLAGIALAPLAGAWLMQRWPSGAGRQTEAAARTTVLSRIAVAMSALLVVAVVLRARHVTPERVAPRATLTYLERERSPHRLLCEDFSWCSAAIGKPGVRVFVDSRCDPYPVPVWNDYLTIVGVAPHWRARLNAWNVNTVIARRDGRFARALARSSDWRLVRRDARYVLYERVIARSAVARAGN